jgi:hypothetical protein
VCIIGTGRGDGMVVGMGIDINHHRYRSIRWPPSLLAGVLSVCRRVSSQTTTKSEIAIALTQEKVKVLWLCFHPFLLNNAFTCNIAFVVIRLKVLRRTREEKTKVKDVSS